MSLWMLFSEMDGQWRLEPKGPWRQSSFALWHLLHMPLCSPLAPDPSNMCSGLFSSVKLDWGLGMKQHGPGNHCPLAAKADHPSPQEVMLQTTFPSQQHLPMGPFLSLFVSLFSVGLSKAEPHRLWLIISRFFFHLRRRKSWRRWRKTPTVNNSVEFPTCGCFSGTKDQEDSKCKQSQNNSILPTPGIPRTGCPHFLPLPLGIQGQREVAGLGHCKKLLESGPQAARRPWHLHQRDNSWAGRVSFLPHQIPPPWG